MIRVKRKADTGGGQVSQLEDLSYIIIEREGCKRLFLSGVAGDVLHQSIREQSHEVFSRIAKVLET